MTESHTESATVIHQHRYDNSLTLLVEPVAHVASAAFQLVMPAGIVTEPGDRQGIAPLMTEMIFRGAGSLDSRGHSEALDELGVDRASGAETIHSRISASMIGARLHDALPLLMDMAIRPQLPDAALEPARDLTLQAIDALEDEPHQKVFIALRQRHYPQPFCRSPYGDADHINAITLDDVKQFWQSTYIPGGAILAVAGNVDFDRVRDHVGELIAGWKGSRGEPALGPTGPRGYEHIHADTQQVHLGLAYDAHTDADEKSKYDRAAAAVLSGGMSGRLFTEVRERHGLCYAVYAAYAASKHLGAMLAYAGTTAPRAQQTLDILTQELRRISEGITREEFDRAIVGMKSRLVMSGESTSARASAIAHDLYTLGRPRSLDELAAEVDSVTLDDLVDHVRLHPAGPMTVVTVGPEPLNPPA